MPGGTMDKLTTRMKLDALRERQRRWSEQMYHSIQKAKERFELRLGVSMIEEQRLVKKLQEEDARRETQK